MENTTKVCSKFRIAKTSQIFSNHKITKDGLRESAKLTENLPVKLTIKKIESNYQKRGL